MKLSSVVQVLGSLCLMLTDGLPVSQSESPKIIGPVKVQIKAHQDKPLILHCDAFTNSEDGVTLIYWLINNAYPDEISSSKRIVELQESTLEEGAILQKSLLIMNVTAEDFKSKFTCVVTNASGMVKKHIRLSETKNDCTPGKRKLGSMGLKRQLNGVVRKKENVQKEIVFNNMN